MKTSKTPLQCPFCNEYKLVSEMLSLAANGKSFCSVVCGRCFACGPRHESVEMAIGLWNKAKRKIDNREWRLHQANIKLVRKEDGTN